MVSGPQQVSAYPEEILYEAVLSCEALHLRGRLEVLVDRPPEYCCRP
jgi:hypothetical protein